MNELFGVLSGLDPLGVLFTIISGAVTGFLFKDIVFPWKVIVLWTAFFLPLYVTRIVFIAAVGTVGSGAVGFYLTLLYVLSSYITRKLGQKFFPATEMLTLDTSEIEVDNT